MAISRIEWTEATWNPTTGCDKISAGCANCYAEVMSKRLQAMGNAKYQRGFEISLHKESLEYPYRWKKPTVVFVNSMSDLFHEKVPFEYIEQVFKVMNDTPQHTYQVLTKRSQRLREIAPFLTWTKNIWMGVSVEDEQSSFRIDDLCAISAITRFISFEPLIGRIDSLFLTDISWIIVGGESGPRARPIRKEWIEVIHAEAIRNDIPFFFKQWGKTQFNENPTDPTINKKHPHHAKGGCSLNGKVYREYPVLV